MKEKKVQELKLRQGDNQTKEQVLAEFKSKSEFLSTAVNESFGVSFLGDEFNFQITMQVLEKSV